MAAKKQRRTDYDAGRDVKCHTCGRMLIFLKGECDQVCPACKALNLVLPLR